MRPELCRSRLAWAACALWLGAAVATAQQPPGKQPEPDKRPPLPAPAPPAPRPAPAPPAPAPTPKPLAPAPPAPTATATTKPKPKPPAPAPPTSAAEDERILRDLELYMLYEMLNDYEIFYDDSKHDEAR